MTKGRPPKTLKHPCTGKERTTKEWADHLGIKVETFRERVLLNGNVPEIYSIGKIHPGPKAKLRFKSVRSGGDLNVREVCLMTGHKESTVRARARKGKDVFAPVKFESFGCHKKHPYPVRYKEMTVKEIARVEGVAEITILKWAKKRKWPERLLPLTDAR